MPTSPPAADTANLARLAAALSALGARIRTEGVPDGRPFSCDATSLAAAETWNLATTAGDLDIAFYTSGTRGYDDLIEYAEEFDLSGIAVETASLLDVIRSKQAANRPKDQRVLPALRALLERPDST